MPRTIQIRKVPDALYRAVKSRAALAEVSLSEFLIAELKEIAARPTLAEFCDRLNGRKRVSALLDSARLVRDERDGR